MNVALVHDYLNQRGGAERVFARIAAAWPRGADLYRALRRARVGRSLSGATACAVRTWLALPFANRYFRALAPLYPRAFEAFDFAASTRSSARRPHGRRAYAFRRAPFTSATSIRSAASPSPPTSTCRAPARPLVERLVEWDREAARRPTRFVANSRNVAARIAKYYGRDSDVLHCPVDLDRFTIGAGRRRLLPRRIAAAALQAHRSGDRRRCDRGRSAARRGERSGGARAARASRAARRRRCSATCRTGGSTNCSATRAPRSCRVKKTSAWSRSRRRRAGRPTIAYRGGGAFETIVEGDTGAFFDEPDAESLAATLRSFDASRFAPPRLRAHAERFSPAQFVKRLREIVDRVYQEQAA